MNARVSLAIRFWLFAGLLAGTALFLHSRSRPEANPPRLPLTMFPLTLGPWTGNTLTLDDEILRVLGDGEFLVRIYRSRQHPAHVDFFLAYFPSQRAGDTIHSPQNCLPGAGWEPVESMRIPLSRSDGGTVLVNRYVIAKGLDRQLVFYWYQAHGRVVASEYWAKFWLVADAIRMNRSDGALVRVITPLAAEESIEYGQKRALEFISEVAPHLDVHIPR